jgi:uncharacterized membrane protein YkvI
LAGIFIAALLLAWLGYELMELGFRLKATAHHQVIYHLCGRWAGFILDFITTAFLFTALAIMLAGGATVFRDSFSCPYLPGLTIMGAVVLITALLGIRGIATANMIVTPILVIAILFISGYSLTYHDFDLSALADSAPAAKLPAPHWLLAAILYASYNLVVGSTVLVPLGAIIRDRKLRLEGAMLGGIILGSLAAVLAIVITLHYPEILSFEIPILKIASSQYQWSSGLYAFTLLAAMYTTAIASLYGCLTKIKALTGLSSTICAFLIIAAALVCGQAGFANLISILFPLFGYATLFFIIRLAWQSCRDS